MPEPRQSAQFDDILRLVPYSGVQFVDCRLDGDVAAGLVATFLEHATTPAQTADVTLIPLVAGPHSTADAQPAVFNPVTGEQLGGERCHVVTAQQALDAFAGTWLPLPFLRFTGRRDRLGVEFDSGPTNWVRCFIGDVAPGTRARSLVLAFDTHLVDGSRLDYEDYAAPCVDDASFGSIFALAAGPSQAGSVLGDTWLLAWVEQVFRARMPVQATSRRTGADLEAMAHYLALLDVLAVSARLPQARFADTIGMRQAFPMRRADLVVDIGETTTSAVLIDADGIEHVCCRELARPAQRHQGALPTRVEFERAPFGDAAVSRLSGRLAAFNWPSVVRIGFEAQRLSLRANGTEGLTGLSELPTHVRSAEPTKTSWRFSTEDGENRPMGPLVAAEWLLEADVMRASATGGRSMVRPQFPRNALLGFFAAELALHAMAQLHDPRRTDERGIVRELRELARIVITQEIAQPAEERAEVLRQVRTGIDQLWLALGWHHGRAGLPLKPEVVSSIGGTLSAQLVVLHEEIDVRFGGDLMEYIRTASASRGRWEVGRDLRIASLDLGERSTNLALLSYTLGGRDGFEPSLQGIDRIATGGARLLRGLVVEHILPAIERALAASGVRHARQFVDETLAGGSAMFATDDPHFRLRFTHKVAMPAARSLLALYCSGAEAQWHGSRSAQLGRLVADAGGRAWPLDRRIAELAAQVGGRDFDLDAVAVPLRRRALERTIEEHMGSILAQVAETIARNDAHVVCVFGAYAELAARNDALLRRLPLGPSRIVLPHNRQYRSLEVLRAPSGSRAEGHAVSLSAACVAGPDRGTHEGPRAIGAAYRVWLDGMAAGHEPRPIGGFSDFSGAPDRWLPRGGRHE